MLTQPLGVLQCYQTSNGPQFIPPPQGNWYMFSTRAQAEKVLALAQQLNPSATLELVKDQDTVMFLLPYPNPQGIDAWVVKGTLPLTAAGEQGTLLMEDYAGDVWDRGPVDQGFGGSPAMLDTNGAYGALGGEHLVYANDGGGLAIFRWSQNPQQPVA